MYVRAALILGILRLAAFTAFDAADVNLETHGSWAQLMATLAIPLACMHSVRFTASDALLLSHSCSSCHCSTSLCRW
jgi:hypothetical protein